MNESHQPSAGDIWNRRLAVLAFIGKVIFNPAFRVGLTAIARFLGYCAVAMAILCLIGVIIGKAPFGNAVGAVIFTAAALLLLRSAKFIRPS